MLDLVMRVSTFLFVFLFGCSMGLPKNSRIADPVEQHALTKLISFWKDEPTLNPINDRVETERQLLRVVIAEDEQFRKLVGLHASVYEGNRYVPCSEAYGPGNDWNCAAGAIRYEGKQFGDRVPLIVISAHMPQRVQVAAFIHEAAHWLHGATHPNFYDDHKHANRTLWIMVDRVTSEFLGQSTTKYREPRLELITP